MALARLGLATGLAAAEWIQRNANSLCACLRLACAAAPPPQPASCRSRLGRSQGGPHKFALAHLRSAQGDCAVTPRQFGNNYKENSITLAKPASKHKAARSSGSGGGGQLAKPYRQSD